jgi:protein-disulfide isomerase
VVVNNVSKEKNMNKRFLIILTVIIVGFIGIVSYGKMSDKANNLEPQRSQNVYGKADSKVTLTEFVDFQCPACYGYYPVIKQVKEEYKDRVRFELRNFPIKTAHQFALRSAASAEAAARQGKFWEMHDKLFEGQKTWQAAKDPQVYFDQYAQSIGLDMTKYAQDRVSKEVLNVINTDLGDATKLGVNGTPAFLLNGKKIESPEGSVEAFSKVLDKALADAGE